MVTARDGFGSKAGDMPPPGECAKQRQNIMTCSTPLNRWFDARKVWNPGHLGKTSTR
jgi:hypothetical protein